MVLSALIRFFIEFYRVLLVFIVYRLINCCGLTGFVWVLWFYMVSQGFYRASLGVIGFGA